MNHGNRSIWKATEILPKPTIPSLLVQTATEKWLAEGNKITEVTQADIDNRPKEDKPKFSRSF